MKKKIFLGVAVLAFTAIVGLNVKMNHQENLLSDLSLANVEALATAETTGGSDKIYCCYPYDRECAKIGNHTTVMGSLRKNSPCN